jgi:hypothetical protein
MHANNYSLAHISTQLYHAPYVTHQNQTLGNTYYYPVNNSIFTHYVLNAIIKPYGKFVNYLSSQTNPDAYS